MQDGAEEPCVSPDANICKRVRGADIDVVGHPQMSAISTAAGVGGAFSTAGFERGGILQIS